MDDFGFTFVSPQNLPYVAYLPMQVLVKQVPGMMLIDQATFMNKYSAVDPTLMPVWL